MLLHEIIEINDKGTSAIITEELYKYRKSLYTYYKAYYPRNCEPMLMVTDVFNACQYALIVPDSEFNDAMDIYLRNDDRLTEDDAELESAKELISFQSIPLSKF